MGSIDYERNSKLHPTYKREKEEGQKQYIADIIKKELSTKDASSQVLKIISNTEKEKEEASESDIKNMLDLKEKLGNDRYEYINSRIKFYSDYILISLPKSGNLKITRNDLEGKFGRIKGGEILHSKNQRLLDFGEYQELIHFLGADFCKKIFNFKNDKYSLLNLNTYDDYNISTTYVKFDDIYGSGVEINKYDDYLIRGVIKETSDFLPDMNKSILETYKNSDKSLKLSFKESKKYANRIDGIIISEDGKFKLIYSENKGIIENSNGIIIGTIDSNMTSYYFTKNENNEDILIYSEGKNLKSFDIKTKEIKTIFFNDLDFIEHIDLSKHNKITGIIGRRSIKLYNMESGEVINIDNNNDDDNKNIFFSPDGKYFIISTKHKIKIYNTNNLNNFNNINLNSEIISSSINNDFIVCGLTDGSVIIYDIQSLEILNNYKHSSWVRNIAFSPDNKYIISAGDNEKVTIYDINKKEIVSQYYNDTIVTRLSFSGNGKEIISGGRDHQLKTYILEN